MIEVTVTGLRRAGRDYKVICPFHEEYVPSFYVVPSQGRFKCYGCGESGEVVKCDGLEAVIRVGDD